VPDHLSSVIDLTYPKYCRTTQKNRTKWSIYIILEDKKVHRPCNSSWAC